MEDCFVVVFFRERNVIPFLTAYFIPIFVEKKYLTSYIRLVYESTDVHQKQVSHFCSLNTF